MFFIVWIVYFVFAFILGVSPTLTATTRKSRLNKEESLHLARSEEEGFKVHGYFAPKSNHIELYLFNCSFKKSIETIIHETRHAWQFKNGFMKFDSEGCVLNVEECEEEASVYADKWVLRFRLNGKEGQDEP